MAKQKHLLMLFMWHLLTPPTTYECHRVLNTNEQRFQSASQEQLKAGQQIRTAAIVITTMPNENNLNDPKQDCSTMIQSAELYENLKNLNPNLLFEFVENNLKQILEQQQQHYCQPTTGMECGDNKSFRTMDKTMTAAETLYAKERSVRVFDNRAAQQQQEYHREQEHFHIAEREAREVKQYNSVDEEASNNPSFSVLEQLRLDQIRQAMQLQQLQEAEKFTQLNQNNANNIEHEFLDESSSDDLAKAGKKKKKKKKKKKRKPSKDKDKKKKKRKKKQKPTNQLAAQQAHILFATATAKPQHYPVQHQKPAAVTNKPQQQQQHHHHSPLEKIQYILRKNSIFKKKKKEYFGHLQHVIYPFIKFIAFFTVLNPFTLAVFLFTLISPVVFGFIGFLGLSLLVKPALHLLFGVKRTVNSINRKKFLEKRRQERLKLSRRPITVHKHFYLQKPIAPPPPHRLRPQSNTKQKPHHHHHPHRKILELPFEEQQQHQQFPQNDWRLQQQLNHDYHLPSYNPILPHVKADLKRLEINQSSNVTPPFL